MSVRIDDFKAAFTEGLARTNRYRVTLPDVTFGTNTDALSLLCDSVTMPGRQIFTFERFTHMKAQKSAYTFGQEDIEISFVLGNDWRAWDYLYDWQALTIGNIGGLRNYTVNYKTNYARNGVIIEHLDTQGRTRKAIQLFNAFPTTLNSVELSNATDNEVIRVTASLAYDNWDVVD